MTYLKQHLITALDAMTAPGASPETPSIVLGKMPHTVLAVLAADLVSLSERHRRLVPPIANIMLDCDILAKLPRTDLARFAQDLAAYLTTGDDDLPKTVVGMIAHVIRERLQANAERSAEIARRAEAILGR